MGLVNALEIQQLPIFGTKFSDTPKKSNLDLLVVSKLAGMYCIQCIVLYSAVTAESVRAPCRLVPLHRMAQGGELGLNSAGTLHPFTLLLRISFLKKT